jgi:alkylresorcinol/alkylpyrone synthase
VDVIDANFPGDARGFLAAHGLDVADVGAWIAHPGGPKVLDAFQRGLGLAADALTRSWESMAAVGNLSSSSVLHVLAGELGDPHLPDEYGLLFALGPGVSAEFVLLQWPESGAAALPSAA